MIVIINEKIFSLKDSYIKQVIKQALLLDKERDVKSILPFAINHEVIEKITQDEDINALSRYQIQDLSTIPTEEQCDFVVNYVLTKMMTPGSILAHAHNFRNGTNNSVDIDESEKLYSLVFKLAYEGSKHSPTAWGALGRCYEFGWGTPINLKFALDCYREVKNEVAYHKADYERVIMKLQKMNE